MEPNPHDKNNTAPHIPHTMRVLAIDPGFDRMGIAILEKTAGKEVVLHSDCITTSRDDEFPVRIAVLCDAFLSHIKKWAPDAIALEKLFFSKNQKTALQVAESRGALISHIGALRIPIYEFAPNQVKLAVTGYGSAPKDQVATMIRATISLPHEPQFDDEMDAIAVGITALASIKSFPQ